MNDKQVKALINELVGFERKYIEIIETVKGTFGGLKQIIFEVKGEKYIIRIEGESFTFDFCYPVEENVSRETSEPVEAEEASVA